MAQVLFRMLRERHPGRPIDVLAPPSTVALTTRMAEVDRGIHLEVGHGEVKLGYRVGLARHLGQQGYTQAFVLPNSIKSALVPALAGIPVRTGYRGEYRYFLLNDIRLLSKRRLPLMIQRFAALALVPGAPLPDPLPLPHLVADETQLATLLEKFGLTASRPLLGLCPGAEYGPAKQWPARHFAAAAADALAAGWQVAVFGGPKDVAISAEIANLVDEQRGGGLVVNLAGETTLLEVVDLLSGCAHVISNDSGLMHIACAVGAAVTVVYGSSSPGFTPPLSERAEIASLSLACSPCFKRQCPLGHTNCLNDLTPDRLAVRFER